MQTLTSNHRQLTVLSTGGGTREIGVDCNDDEIGIGTHGSRGVVLTGTGVSVGSGSGSGGDLNGIGRTRLRMELGGSAQSGSGYGDFAGTVTPLGSGLGYWSAQLSARRSKVNVQQK